MVMIGLKALVSQSMVALTASVGKFYGVLSHELTMIMIHVLLLPFFQRGAALRYFRYSKC